MLALLAQAAPAGEWHDGWQLAVTTITALTVVVGWLHRQSKSDLKSVKDDLSVRITDVKDDLKTEVASAERRLKAEITRVETDLKADIAKVEADVARVEADVARVEVNIAEVSGDLKDLKDKLYDDARSQAAMYQWQLAATRPATGEASPRQSPPQPKQLAETSTS